MKGMVVTFNVIGGEQGQWAVLQVSGELDLVTSPVLRQRVHDEVAEGGTALSWISPRSCSATPAASACSSPPGGSSAPVRAGSA